MPKAERKINKIWSCRRTGGSHIRRGIENQDSCCGRHFSWGDIIVSSDGVGSCRNSAAGSRAACRAAVAAVDHCIRQQIADPETISRKLHSLWLEYLGETAPDTACATCRTAFITGDKIYTLSVGDGMTGISSREPETTVILSDNGEFANVTTALFSQYEPEEWRWQIFDKSDFCGVLLCTDGISENYKPQTKPRFVCSVINAFAPLERNRRRSELKKLLRKNAAGHDDDKAMICISWD